MKRGSRGARLDSFPWLEVTKEEGKIVVEDEAEVLTRSMILATLSSSSGQISGQ